MSSYSQDYGNQAMYSPYQRRGYGHQPMSSYSQPGPMPQPVFPILQPYPGNQFINSAPQYQFNPSFDGYHYHGTQVNPYLNYMFEDVNMIQDALYQRSGSGYPPFPSGGFQW